jgi:hypothetical protein
MVTERLAGNLLEPGASPQPEFYCRGAAMSAFQADIDAVRSLRPVLIRASAFAGGRRRHRAGFKVLLPIRFDLLDQGGRQGNVVQHLGLRLSAFQ